MQASALGSWGSAVAVPGLYTTGLVFVEHGLNCSSTCEIFWTRGQTRVSSIGRWILYH